jgi:hypothetical protein
MEWSEMLTNALRIIVIAAWLLSVGCKKDNAEESEEQKAAQPEKVNKAKASQPEAKTPPKARKLVKAKDKKVAAKPGIKRPARTARSVKPPVKEAAAKVDARSPKAPPPSPRVANKGGDPPFNTLPPSRVQDPAPTPRIGRKPRTGSKAIARIPSTGPVKIRPNAELLLRKQDLIEVLNVARGIDVHQMSGTDKSGSYDGVYWGSAKGDKYIAGIQVWHPNSHLEAQRRYERMLRTYPNAQENTAITGKTFLAHWNDFIYLAFLDPGKQTVISLTCHRRACSSPTKLVQLGNRIKERI